MYMITFILKLLIQILSNILYDVLIIFTSYFTINAFMSHNILMGTILSMTICLLLEIYPTIKNIL